MLMPVLMLAYYQGGMLCLYSDLYLEIQISYHSQITVSIQFLQAAVCSTLIFQFNHFCPEDLFCLTTRTYHVNKTTQPLDIWARVCWSSFVIQSLIECQESYTERTGRRHQRDVSKPELVKSFLQGEWNREKLSPLPPMSSSARPWLGGVSHER